MPSVQRQMPDSSSSKTKTEPGMISDVLVVVAVEEADGFSAGGGDDVVDEEDEVE